MKQKTQRRLVALVLVLGGPLVGFWLNEDRGLLLGLFVSIVAVVWTVVEERKLL